MINAICWTLIHSIWQGLLAALAAGIVLVSTRRSSPRLRYNFLVLVFFGLLVAASGTLIKELYSQPYAATLPAMGLRTANAAHGNIIKSPVAVKTIVSQEGPKLETIINQATRFCDAHAQLIVTLWLLIFMMRLAKTGISLGYVSRLRRYQTSPAPLLWTQKVAELARALGLRRRVQLLQSAIIRVPVVIGYLRPVILVPLGILAQMPQDQLEAVLVHELAHIRRGDYLVNILQGIVEAVLFFNPAVWWISSLIRSERENCCDDIAVGTTNNKSYLINALVAFQEYSASVPVSAVAFPGAGKNQLLDRVKRIVYNRNKTLNAMEKILLGACLVAAGSLTLAFSPLNKRGVSNEFTTLFHPSPLHLRDTLPPAAPVPPAPVAAPAPAPVQPTAPKEPIEPGVAPQPALAPSAAMPAPPPLPAAPAAPRAPELKGSDLEGGTFYGNLQMNNGKVTYARGIWVKGGTRKYYYQGSVIVTVSGLLTEMYKDGKKVTDEQLKSSRNEAYMIIEKLEKERQEIDNSRPVTATSSADVSTASGYSTSNYTTAAKTYTTTANIASSDAAPGGSISVVGYPGSSVAVTGYSKDTSVNDWIYIILKDIYHYQLATNANDISFSLDNNQFTVNGVSQSKEMFQRFRDKYVRDPKDSFSYARKGSATTTAVYQVKNGSGEVLNLENH